VRDTETPLLFHHSSRVYYWGALAGKRRGSSFDPELLYAGAMFHDMGLTYQHSSADERFEVDGGERRPRLPAEPRHRTTRYRHRLDRDRPAHDAGHSAAHAPGRRSGDGRRRNDVLGLSYGEYSDTEREAIVHAHPRSAHFKEDIIQAFYDGIKHKPETTFGNVKADVLADKDPHFTRGNFCSVIRNSAWRG